MIPGAFVHIPDAWRQADVVRSLTNPFEFEQRYSNGTETLRESELLRRGLAWYRIQIDRFTVRDFDLRP